MRCTNINISVQKCNRKFNKSYQERMVFIKMFNLLDIKVNYCIIDKGFREQEISVSFANGNSIRFSLGIDNIFKILSAEPMTKNRNKLT